MRRRLARVRLQSGLEEEVLLACWVLKMDLESLRHYWEGREGREGQEARLWRIALAIDFSEAQRCRKKKQEQERENQAYLERSSTQLPRRGGARGIETGRSGCPCLHASRRNGHWRKFRTREWHKGVL